MKREARLIGFDDGPFTFPSVRASASAGAREGKGGGKGEGPPTATTTPVVGVMTRGAGYVEAVLAGRVTIDGEEATDEILRLLAGTGFVTTAKAVVFNGGALGGFNVLDLDRLHARLGLPVAAVMRDEPDDGAVRAALDKHFADAGRRHAMLTAQPVERVRLAGGACYVRRVGATREFFEDLLASQTVRGRTPEPLRIAHLIATAMVEGRSRGA